MRKNKSFLREILRYLLALTGVLIGVLLAFLLVSYHILEEEIKASSDGFLQIYNSELNNSISKMDGILRNVTAQGEDLYKIKADDEKDRVLGSVSLQRYLTGLLQEDSEAAAIIIYDDTYEVCLDATDANVKADQKQLLRAYAQEALHDDQISSFMWTFAELDDHVYLCKILKTDTRTIVICADTDKLLRSLSGQDLRGRMLVLTDMDGDTGKFWGEEGDISERDRYFIQQAVVLADQLQLYCYTAKDSVFSQISSGMTVVALFVVLEVLFAIFLLRYTRREIVRPMQEIIGDMEAIRGGDYERRISGSYRTHEFQVLKDTTNQMVDEVVGLKIDSYEKMLTLQDVELKSIRLQLKPHFFLNALNTISSLSAQGKHEDIRTYIEALSRNVRYMFRAGFHTVPVEEELRHVDHYLEMQEMKYPDCVFYLCELPDECRGWKIPQMLIHTFVENEFKHAVVMGETLTLLVKISCQMYGGEEMLLIEVEDDGRGYPEEVTAYMNGQAEKTAEPGSRVGLWSIKRMLGLMYDRQDLIWLENTRPHGCLNRIYIPAEPVREREEEREISE